MTTPQDALRLTEFIAARSRAKGIDPDVVASINGHELLLSDIRSLAAQLEQVTKERDELRAQRVPLSDEQILSANYPDGEENGPTVSAPDFDLICFARQVLTASLRGEG
jgi:hypothetical protein